MVDRFLKYDYLAALASFEPRAERLPHLRAVVVLADTVPAGCVAYGALASRGAEIADAVIDAIRVRPDDIAYLLYTSGSTAAPKGVPLQHYALVENMWNIGERMHVSEHDRLWLAVSLFWGLGCENALLNMMTHGACTVLQEHFEPGRALELIERERCTVIYATPNMAQALLEHPDRGRRDLSALRTGGTIGTPEQIMRLVDLGASEICNIYGATETYGNCSVTDGRAPIERRLVSVGEPLPGVRVRIVDPETGVELPAGETGEIRIKGYVMPGYRGDPALNEKSFDADGFFVTGDLGYLDDEGWLFFRGRLKEMVKTGGINVAPVEVEEILMAHEAVRLAYVVGVPDAVRDEVIAAVVVRRHGQTIDAAGLDAHCREALAAYKCPRLYRFVDEDSLPLTTTGKLEKRRLPGLFADREEGG
jgi:fatty-acyl-CoA synthase